MDPRRTTTDLRSHAHPHRLNTADNRSARGLFYARVFLFDVDDEDGAPYELLIETVACVDE